MIENVRKQKAMRAGALKRGAQPKCMQKRRCTERKSHYAENYAKSDLRSIGRQHAVFETQI